MVDLTNRLDVLPLAGSSVPAAERTVAIGDIGGHLDVLRECFEAEGVDLRTGQVPPGLTIVQVGDLVHKGPDDAGVISLVNLLLRREKQPESGRYIQLLGNHDAHYLGGPSVAARKGVVALDPASLSLLRALYEDELMHLATSVPSADGDLLLTHGGLTRGAWEDLGSPTTADDAAMRLNALLGDPQVSFRAGAMTTSVANPRAGVTDARTGVEVAPDWLLHGDAPFSQVHGHEGVWWWPIDAYHDDCPESVRALSSLDRARRFSCVDLGDRYLLGIDWTLGAVRPAQELRALSFATHQSPLDDLDLIPAGR